MKSFNEDQIYPLGGPGAKMKCWPLLIQQTSYYLFLVYPAAFRCHPGTQHTAVDMTQLHYTVPSAPGTNQISYSVSPGLLC